MMAFQDKTKPAFAGFFYCKKFSKNNQKNVKKVFILEYNVL